MHLKGVSVETSYLIDLRLFLCRYYQLPTVPALLTMHLILRGEYFNTPSSSGSRVIPL